MLKELILSLMVSTGFAMGSNPQSKAVTYNTQNYAESVALYGTSSESFNIINDCYFINYEDTDLSSVFSEANLTYRLVVYGMDSFGADLTTTILYYSAYMLVNGYAVDIPSLSSDANYSCLINPFIVNTNDGEYTELCPSASTSSYFATSDDDPSSDFNIFGFCIPKAILDTDDEYFRFVYLALYDPSNNSFYGQTWLKGSLVDSSALNTDLHTPTYFDVESWKPFNSSDTNFLVDDYSTYSQLNGTGSGWGTESDLYLYKYVLNDTLFINGGVGVGNYLPILMLDLGTGSYQYSFTLCQMYWSTDVTPFEDLRTNYGSILNRDSYMIHSYPYSQMAQDPDNVQLSFYGGNWYSYNSDKFIILESNNVYYNISEIDNFKAHMRVGSEVVSTSVSTTADIIDVFTMIGLAFNGFGNFLGISIVPGITIGLLISIPLMITLILFIIHLFKKG